MIDNISNYQAHRVLTAYLPRTHRAPINSYLNT